jgi:hypothetical protein
LYWVKTTDEVIHAPGLSFNLFSLHKGEGEGNLFYGEVESKGIKVKVEVSFQLTEEAIGFSVVPSKGIWEISHGLHIAGHGYRLKMYRERVRSSSWQSSFSSWWSFFFS